MNSPESSKQSAFMPHLQRRAHQCHVDTSPLPAEIQTSTRFHEQKSVVDGVDVVVVVVVVDHDLRAIVARQRKRMKRHVCNRCSPVFVRMEGQTKQLFSCPSAVQLRYRHALGERREVLFFQVGCTFHALARAFLGATGWIATVFDDRHYCIKEPEHLRRHGTAPVSQTSW
uniref:Uncharacterized protein n=1 Tax=Peronospora matthiolae TaxID=2874970 RepID=A0AAV1URX1_9STRA